MSLNRGLATIGTMLPPLLIPEGKSSPDLYKNSIFSITCMCTVYERVSQRLLKLLISSKPYKAVHPTGLSH